MIVPKLKCAPVPAGSTIAVIAPASSAKFERLDAGISALRNLGYNAIESRHLRGHVFHYFSGSVEERLGDFHAAFADPAIAAIICSRGGYGSNYLLEGLDLELIKQNPKPLFAYSDLSVVQSWLLDRVGLVSFHGPMAAADFYRDDGVHHPSFNAAIDGGMASLGAAEGLRTLRPGSVTGTLYGGCLSMIVSSLGTPFAAETEGKLLFLEDVNVKPYQIDRMLRQMILAGKLERVKGIIFGEMKDCGLPNGERGQLEEVLLRVLERFDGPIGFGLRSGHVSRSIVTLPFGIEARLELKDGGRWIRSQSGIFRAGGRELSAMQAAINKRRHIHLIGICGTAMASLAGMLQLKGHRVTGSDMAAYPPMSDFLRELGITIAEPFSAKNLDPAPDLVIVGNALSRGNPEVEYILDERIPFTSLARIIHDEFVAGHESLVVAGTHGKTTTTSMLAWIYEVAARRDAQLAPSFLIGGIAENFGSSFQLRQGRPFIIEGDEYDTAFFDKGPKFMHYFPDALILTHVEFDHADIYRDLDSVKTAFKRLVNLVPQRGRVVAFDGTENVTECVTKAFCSRRAIWLPC